jgi:surface antigen
MGAATPEAPQKPAIAGPLAGSFGAELNDADRQSAFDAELAALDSGQRKSWRGKRGVFGFVEPAGESGGCRAFVETIYLAGRPKQGHGQGCKQADGTWRITG